MRLLVMVGFVALVLVLNGCDAPTQPVVACTPGDTVRTTFPLVSADKRDTVWAHSWHICPAKL